MAVTRYRGALRVVDLPITTREVVFEYQPGWLAPAYLVTALSLLATLALTLDRSGAKIQYQLGKIERKAGREALRRDERARRDAASLYGLIYPERHLQERLYSFLPFLARHGLDLIGRIYEAIDLECADHRLMVI